MRRKDSLVKSIDVLDAFKRAVLPKKQKPWESIVDYATSPSFCGNNLYPKQQTLLKLMYLETEHMTAYDLDVINKWSESFANKAYTVGVQEDIWDRIKYLKENDYNHFRQIQAVQGRRASKGHIGGIIMSERLSALVAMDDPQSYFGIDTGHDIYSMVIATTGVQAQRFLFADLVSQVRKNSWLKDYTSRAEDHLITLQTPADIRNTAELVARGTPPMRPLSSIKAIPVSSNSGSSRGGAVISAGFDEFAFTLSGDSSRSGSAMYSAIEPSLDQFGKEGLIYMPSSPWSKAGKFFELYESGSVLMEEYLSRQGKLVNRKNKAEAEEEILEDAKGVLANPEMLIIQLESWGLYEDWEDSQKILSVYDSSYEKRKKNKASALETDKGVSFKFRDKHALEISDSFIHEDEIYRVVDTAEHGFDIEASHSEIEVVKPGPKFENAIQVKPDINGTTAQKAMAALESRDRSSFRVERRGQFLSSIDAYIDPEKISAIFSEFWNGRQLEMQAFGAPKYHYYMHADPAKVGADFAVMIAHKEKSPFPDSDGNFYDHMIIDYYNVYRGIDFPEGEIDYLLVIKDMQDKMRSFPTMRSITMDQFNSVMPLQTLKKYAQKTRKQISIREQTFTGPWNQKMYQSMKTAINLGWVHAPTDNLFRGEGCLLEKQLEFLHIDKGKVVKGTGFEVSKDDLVDCLGVLIVQLLGDQIESNFELLDNLSASYVGQTPSIADTPAKVQASSSNNPHSLLDNLY